MDGRHRVLDIKAHSAEESLFSAPVPQFYLQFSITIGAFQPHTNWMGTNQQASYLTYLVTDLGLGALADHYVPVLQARGECDHLSAGLQLLSACCVAQLLLGGLWGGAGSLHACWPAGIKWDERSGQGR